MKILAFILTGFAFIHSSYASSGSGAATAAAGSVAVVGAAAGAGATMYYNWLNFELSDWKDSNTDSTVELGNQCGVDYEFRLIGNSRGNYVYVALKNNSIQEMILKPEETSMTFGNGRERLANFKVSMGNVELKAGWTIVGAIPFPSKWDFKDQNEVTIQVPIYDSKAVSNCSIKATIHRDPKVPISDNSITDYAVLEYSLGMGATFARTGSLKNVGNNFQLAFDLGMYLYFNAHHGIFFEVLLEGFGSAASVKNITGLNSSVGYSYRHFFAKDWAYVYDIGVGGYDFENTSTTRWSSVGSGFSAMHKFSVDYRLGETSGGGSPLVADGFLGLSVYQIWVPSMSSSGFGAVGGNTFGLLARFKFGL